MSATRLEESAALPVTCQNGTFLEFHSAVTSANGLLLRTSRRSKLPWLEEGALNFNMTPGPHVCRTPALASGGRGNKPVARQSTLFNRGRTGSPWRNSGSPLWPHYVDARFHFCELRPAHFGAKNCFFGKQEQIRIFRFFADFLQEGTDFREHEVQLAAERGFKE